LNAQQQTQQQQDDLFSSSSQLPSNQGGFRFGGQNAVGQSSQPTPTDDFPPLNRNGNGDIGPDRVSGMIPNVGFGAPSNGIGFGAANPPPQPARSNGLLNALSGSSRTIAGNRVASPASISGKHCHNRFVVFLLTVIEVFRIPGLPLKRHGNKA